MTRVLFVAEAVTLAHVARPLALAASLGSAYQVSLAVDSRYDRLIGDAPFARHPLQSISGARFLAALADGAPVYDAETLHRYVLDDLALLDTVRPDVVVGDFRLSLSVSARLRSVPYVTITNAYWSPYAKQRYPVPEIRIVERLGLRLAGPIVNAARPLFFRMHARPLNRVRGDYGLPSLGSDLLKVYTDADYVLYADDSALFPLDGLPPQHGFLGPLAWSPEMATPPWWDEVKADRLAFVSLGTSGRTETLPRVLAGLRTEGHTAMVATAGRAVADGPYVADFLPGGAATARSQLVVCNGGSLTTQQAMLCGVPVLGICSNLDQFLNMEPLVASGAAIALRASAVTPERVAAAAKTLAQLGAKAAARRIGASLARYDAGGRFRAAVAEIVAACRDGRPADLAAALDSARDVGLAESSSARAPSRAS